MPGTRDRSEHRDRLVEQEPAQRGSRPQPCQNRQGEHHYRVEEAFSDEQGEFCIEPLPAKRQPMKAHHLPRSAVPAGELADVLAQAPRVLRVDDGICCIPDTAESLSMDLDRQVHVLDESAAVPVERVEDRGPVRGCASWCNGDDTERVLALPIHPEAERVVERSGRSQVVVSLTAGGAAHEHRLGVVGERLYDRLEIARRDVTIRVEDGDERVALNQPEVFDGVAKAAGFALSRLVPQNVHTGKATQHIAGPIGGRVVDSVHVRGVEAGFENACDAAADQCLFVACGNDDADSAASSWIRDGHVGLSVRHLPLPEAKARPSRERTGSLVFSALRCIGDVARGWLGPDETTCSRQTQPAISLAVASGGRDEVVPLVKEWVDTAAVCRAGTLVAVSPLGSQMIEHRRAERFPLVHPAVGSLRMVQDVEIARLHSRQAIVIAPGPLPRGERLLLEIPVARGAHPCTVLVRVVHNRVVMDDGSLRRQVCLQVIERAPRDRGLEGVRIPRGRSVMGALIRRVPVRVVEASTTGCVFESPSIVIEGSVGFVQTRTSTHDRSEAVRVRRTSQTSNAVWQYRMAAEFLTLGPKSPDSFCGLATIMSVGSLLPLNR